MEYNFREIEKKWQQKWVDNKTYKVVEDESKKKFYVLNMFLIRREQDFMLVTRWLHCQRYLCSLQTLAGL